MTTPPPDKPADFTASDILSADAWTGRVAKPVLGIDVVCTKIAVDFQNLTRESVDYCVRRNLELLRGATGSDCAFLAPLNPEDSTIAEVRLARSAFAQGRPEGLTGLGLESVTRLRWGRAWCGRGEIRGAANRLGAARDAAGAGQARRFPRARARHAARRLGREPAAADGAHRHAPRHPT